MPSSLKFSEAVSLAMHAAGLLAAGEQQSLSTKAIAAHFHVSEAHLSKVLQRLVKVGLLHSLRGPKGGFSLAKEPQEITLLEVYEAIEGPLEQVSCLFKTPLCDGEGCLLGGILEGMNKTLMDHLSKTNLREVSKLFTGAQA